MGHGGAELIIEYNKTDKKNTTCYILPTRERTFSHVYDDHCLVKLNFILLYIDRKYHNTHQDTKHENQGVDV